MALRVRTSTTACWKLAAMSATSWGSGGEGSGYGAPAIGALRLRGALYPLVSR